MKVLTEEDFDNKYTYDTTIVSTEFDPESQIGMLETYGDDMLQVRAINKIAPMRLWTMVDGEHGMYLLQGLHYVNRIYYVVTNEEAESEDEEYLIDLYDQDEDE